MNTTNKLGPQTIKAIIEKANPLEQPAAEPPWRALEPGEIIQEGDEYRGKGEGWILCHIVNLYAWPSGIWVRATPPQWTPTSEELKS